MGIALLALLWAITAQAAEAPDLIRFKNGGMVRGTIVELVPGDQVEIQTSSGEKRVYKMSEVDYAGAAQAEPQPGPQAQPPFDGAPGSSILPIAVGAADLLPPVAPGLGPKLMLRVTSAEPGLRLHERVRTAVVVVGGSEAGPSRFEASARVSAYRDLCSTPCSLALAPGRYRLALSTESGTFAEGKPVSILPESRELRAKLVSGTGARVAGWVIVGGAAVAGTAMAVSSFSYSNHSPGLRLDTGLLIGASFSPSAVPLWASFSPRHPTVQCSRCAEALARLLPSASVVAADGIQRQARQHQRASRPR